MWSDLLGDEQHDALKQLVCVQRGDGQIEKETVEHRTRNQLELFDEEHRQANEYVRHY